MTMTSPYDTEPIPGMKEFPVGDTSVDISPPTFEAFMILQKWVRANQNEKNSTEEEDEKFFMGYAVKCIEACTGKFITEREALQVFLKSGGGSSDVVQAAIKLCIVNKDVKVGTLEQVPTSSPES